MLSKVLSDRYYFPAVVPAVCFLSLKLLLNYISLLLEGLVINMQFRVKRLFLSVSLFLINHIMLLSNLGFVFPFMRISFIGAILFMVSYRLLEKWLYAESAHENKKWFGNFILVNLLQVTF